MSRLSKQSAVVMLLGFVAVAMAPTLSFGQGGQSPLLPPNANFRGKSFTEWNVLALEWEIATSLGGQDLPGTVQKVRFMPFNFAGDEFDIRVKPGTAIAHPVLPIYGELYDDGTQDDPDADYSFLYEATFIDARLDGQVLFQGFASDYEPYSFGTVVLDGPIFYAEPQPRGPGLNAIAATFVFGTGAVFHPLPVGEHTLVIDVQGPLGDYHTTYHITVSPK
ncbi:hypothetical protein [Tautonia plasticadhaerens]|uniref:Uncharacterized protein n=1 Tax=Tautonia plasticadhaerens TaxID=2527974 RepID=A0A518H096_9BACT|nr:hypothetical protein [Tautonia plasticadhaerens]QDV34266.1 hypothetical protein ElP_21510 [Tautonia plasticadhaerens]